MRSCAVRGGVWCLVTVAVGGCSSGEPEPATTEPTATTIAESATTEVDGSGSAPTSAPGGADQQAYVVAIDVAVDRLDLSDQLEVAIDPDGLDEIDPFTRFSSCSGLRASVGTFTVTAVDDSGVVVSVSVVTVDRVTGPGIYDADVRVEPASAGAVTALGTVTLDPGLRSGSFRAFESTGEEVSGTFTCEGPAGTPDLIADGDASGDGLVDEGVLRAVEVVALLRRGEDERIVGLTLDPAEVVAAEADCPGVTGGDGPTLVRVEGGPAVGAITTFELAGGQSPIMRMRVGGASYEIDAVAIVADDRGAAGSFSGVTADGIAIDGAFRCV